MHSLSLIYQVGDFFIEGHWVGQVGPAFHKPVLAGPDPLVVLRITCIGSPDMHLEVFFKK